MKKITTNTPFEKKFCYSRAIVRGGWCFMAGVTGYDYKKMELPEDVKKQTENCMQTIQGVLDEAGFSFTDIMRIRYTLTDRRFVDDVTPVLQKYLAEACPSATLAIAGLLQPQMKIELEVTAFKG